MGSSTGLKRVAESLGVGLDLTAVNHWPTAVQTHAANHPEARHVCQSVDNIDPRKVTGGTLDLLTWKSRAKRWRTVVANPCATKSPKRPAVNARRRKRQRPIPTQMRLNA